MVDRVLVTGGAGYVGSSLVPKLLRQGFRVRVFDLYIYGTYVLDSVRHHPNLEQVKGDLRDTAALREAVNGCDAIIHLACISNDPSFDLNPELGRSINYDAFLPLIQIAKKAQVKRFVFASSSSVYGVKQEDNVTEDLSLNPLTDYSRYKALCEEILLRERQPGFVGLILRPATVCGYAPRLRLDLTVNILTNHALLNRRIKVFGGQQKRPNIHIDDVTDLYSQALEWPDEAVDGRIYNAGYENHRVSEIADIVRREVGGDVEIESTPTDDHRSYHISSEKIKRELGFVAKRTIADAVRDLVGAFERGLVQNSMTDKSYYNIKTMQALGMQ